MAAGSLHYMPRAAFYWQVHGSPQPFCNEKFDQCGSKQCTPQFRAVLRLRHFQLIAGQDMRPHQSHLQHAQAHAGSRHLQNLGRERGVKSLLASTDGLKQDPRVVEPFRDVLPGGAKRQASQS